MKKHLNKVCRPIQLLVLTVCLFCFAHTESQYDSDTFVPYVALANKVQKQPERQVSQADVSCLTQNIYFEAEYGNYNDKLAVATVTLNRVRDDKFPKSVCAVVWQRRGHRCQFNWTCDGKSDRIKYPNKYAASLQVAKEVLHYDKRSSIIGNALFFHSKRVRPGWSYRMRRVANIGQHIFYERRH